jgi:hypothetical protein
MLRMIDTANSCKMPYGWALDGTFLLLRPYHGEHGPEVLVTPEYIVLQRVLQKPECMSTLTKSSKKLA